MDPAVGASPQADALETLVSSIASTLPVSKIYPLSRRIETIRMLKSSSVIRMAVLLVFDRPTTSAVVPRQTGDRHAERTRFFCSGSLPVCDRRSEATSFRYRWHDIVPFVEERWSVEGEARKM